MSPQGPPAFSSDGQFVHYCPATLITVIMSICSKCGEYVCASNDQHMIEFVEQLHVCPEKPQSYKAA